MGRLTRPARANLRDGKQRPYKSGLGAYHPVSHNGELVPFIRKVRGVLEEALPLPDFPDDDSTTERFKIYTDPERIGVRVLEQRVCTAYLNRHRKHVSPNDMGRIKGEIQDLTDHLDLWSPDLNLTFSSLGRVGCDPVEGRPDGSAKFALMPDPEDPLRGQLVMANEIIFGYLQRVFPDFKYPNSKYKYDPRYTFVKVYGGASKEAVNGCEDKLCSLLETGPITVPIGSLVLLPR